MDLTRLPTWSADGDLHVVVEAPRGSGVKMRFDPDLGCFVFGKTLTLGLTYPFDWGFLPSTIGDDGDPLDALVITDFATAPGVLIPCRPLGVVQLSERKETGHGRERNDRIICVPVGAERLVEVHEPSGLSRRLREEIEQFFLNTTFFTSKHARLEGWKGPATARALTRRGQRAWKKKHGGK